MNSYRSKACGFTAAPLLILSFLAFPATAAEQGRPPEPIVPLPNMTGTVQPLSAEEVAAIPAAAGVRRREDSPTGLPSAAAPQRLDLDARLALHSRGGVGGAIFGVDYLGDSFARDINPGDGICLDIYGACGLRAAIQEANALPGLDTILLPPGVITLATTGASENGALTGDLDITDSVIIEGAGASLSFINGDGAATGDRVFHVLQGSGGYVTVDFVDLSIHGGSVTGQAGGGILAGCRADVVVLRSNVFENFGSLGGGLSLTGSGCSAGTLPRMVVYESAVYRNTANSNLTGAGIDQFAGGTLNVINSTIALNVNASATATAAGGISVSSTTPNVATLRSSTIIDNGAPNATVHDGVGVRIGTGATTVLIDNVIGFNTFNNSSLTANCGGSSATISSAGGNIYNTGAVTCPVTADDSTGNGLTLVNGIALNAPGETQTASVSATSAARSFGKNCILPQDQRGVERPLRACSSGAFQFVVAPPPPMLPEVFDDGFE